MINKEFAEPPTKELMQLLKDNNILPAPVNGADVAEIAVETNNLLKQIHKQEAECLRTIHARYCLLKGLPVNYADVTQTQARPERPNYTEYYIFKGTPRQYFLMSAEVAVNEAGVIELDIIFNGELARQGE